MSRLDQQGELALARAPHPVGIPAELVRAKQYVTADQIEVNRKMRPVELMPAPNFIFCTGDAEPLKHLEGRRFHIARMGDAG